MQRGEKYLLNPSGEKIPIKGIKWSDRKKHNTVEKIFTRITQLKSRTVKEKNRIYTTLDEYFDYLARTNNENKRTPNCTLTNYSSTKQLIIKSSDVIEFDEKISFAITKLKKCMEKWGSDSHPNLALITAELFRIERSGRINRNFLLSLFRYNIKDKEWLAALEIIKESINISSKKEYIIFRERENANKNWQTIKLNLSSIEEGI